MAGIYGVLSQNIRFDKQIFKKFYSYDKDNILNQESVYNDFIYGRSVLGNFQDDRLLFENDELILCYEGINYNTRETNLEEFITESYNQKGINFIEEIKGRFNGFILDKIKQKLFLFTDHLSTKPLYIYYNKINNIFFFASELKVITKSLRELNLEITPDEDGFRCLLTFGYMLNDLTLIEEIKKMSYGTILTIDLRSFNLNQKKYYQIRKREVRISEEKIIQQIDSKIINAIKNEWNKDLEYKYNHFSFLSGGLDSRVNTILGSKFTPQKVNTFTFSYKGTSDEKIANKIARDYKFSHSFFDLGDGDYLVGKEYEYVKANDGLVVYYGAAHQQFALENYSLTGIGLAHSGQIGDVIFGSFTNKELGVETNLKRLAFNNDHLIINKITEWKKIKSNNFFGADAEIFSIENRQINGTLNGDRACSYLVEVSSPFYDRELLDYCLNIPDKLKYDQMIYKKWMNNLHEELVNYKWEKTGAYPTLNPINKMIYFINRSYNYFMRNIGKGKINMNPFEYWYKINTDFRESIELAFSKNVLNEFDTELKKDIQACFHENRLVSKMSAVAAIQAYKLHFID